MVHWFARGAVFHVLPEDILPYSQNTSKPRDGAGSMILLYVPHISKDFVRHEVLLHILLVYTSLAVLVFQVLTFTFSSPRVPSPF